MTKSFNQTTKVLTFHDCTLQQTEDLKVKYEGKKIQIDKLFGQYIVKIQL